MDDIIDLLKIKIEKAKRELSLETVNAIDAVDWRGAVIGMRAKKGYTFEQLGDLELETELLLCGLVSPENYPKELEARMKIPRATVNELVNDMNDLVFKKIREELIKNIERKKIFVKKEEINTQVLDKAGIEIVPDLPAVPGAQLMQAEKLELNAPVESRDDMLKKIEKPEEVHPILTQKLSSSFQTPMVKTEHSLDNITTTNTPALPTGAGTANPANVAPQKPKVDPYRMPIE